MTLSLDPVAAGAAREPAPVPAAAPASAGAAPVPEAAPASEAALEHEYRPAHEIDLRSTLLPHRRGRHDPATVFADDGIWLAFRTEEGAATVRLTRSTSGVRMQGWGPGAGPALDSIPALLGADDDWSGVDVSGHPLLAEARHRNPGLRLTRSQRVVDALAAAVIEQKITSTEAFRAWRVLVTQHGDPAPGPAPHHMRVPPTAEGWRRIPSWDWHRAGVDPRRSRTVVETTARGSALQRLAAREGVDARRLLETFSGIGVWTSAEIVQRTHGDPDAVSFGDYHLSKTIGYALVGEELDDDGLAELLEPWSGHRQRVVRLVLATGIARPRHGARITIQDHRAH